MSDMEKAVSEVIRACIAWIIDSGDYFVDDMTSVELRVDSKDVLIHMEEEIPIYVRDEKKFTLTVPIDQL